MGRATSRAVLGALVVAVAAALYTQAVRVGTWEPDEYYFSELARAMWTHLPGSLVAVPDVVAYNNRGLQRLLTLVLAWPLGGLDGPGGFRVAHALLALAYSSAAVPVYLLARGVAAGRAWALVAAALSIVAPWAVLGTSFLTEPVAYPAALWALWGAWRAVVVPGVRADLVALALVVVAGLARTNLLALGIVAPAAVAVRALLAAGPRGAVGLLRREHPILGALAGLAVVAFVLQALGLTPSGGVVGGYQVSLFDVEWDPLPRKFAEQASRIVVGVGVVPVLLALPWIARHALRRRDADVPAQAFALVAVAAFATLLLTTVYAAPEERYLMYCAPLVLVPAVAAIARRDVPPAGVAVAGLLVAVLVHRVAWPPAGEASTFLVDPARSVFRRLVLERNEAALPGASIDAVAVVVVLAGVLLAVLLRRAPRALVAVVALLALVQVAQTGYVVVKRADLTAEPVALDRRAWVDRAVDAPVALQGEGVAAWPAFDAEWHELAYFNRRVEVYASTKRIPPDAVGRHLARPRIAYDARTGAIRSSSPLPRYWLVTTLFRPIVLAETPVAEAGYLSARLVRLRGAPRAVWRWAGVSADGFVEERRPDVALHVYPAAREGLRTPCLRLSLLGPPAYAGLHRARVTAPGYRAARAVRAQRTATFDVPLTARTTRIAIATDGVVDFPGDRRVAFQVAGAAAVECGA